MNPTLMWLLVVMALGASLLAFIYGLLRLQAIRRRTKELHRREEELFLYDQYHAAALQSWAKAERATQDRQWETAQEAWQNTVQCLEKARSLPMGSAFAHNLDEELREARQRLEQVRSHIHHQQEEARDSSSPSSSIR